MNYTFLGLYLLKNYELKHKLFMNSRNDRIQLWIANKFNSENIAPWFKKDIVETISCYQHQRTDECCIPQKILKLPKVKTNLATKETQIWNQIS